MGVLHSSPFKSFIENPYYNDDNGLDSIPSFFCLVWPKLTSEEFLHSPGFYAHEYTHTHIYLHTPRCDY